MSKRKRPSPDQKELCQRFKESLDFLGLTPASAYQKLGYTTPATIYTINAGRCLPDMTKLIALSRLKTPEGRRINIDWLVTGTGPKAYPAPEKETSEIEALLSFTAKEKLDAVAVLLGKK
ncbi:hypothetical protein [Alcanivorax sp.]|uniref:hypothetical protein n=1 Tax=Alcanivorax sp. TaxID=1872427 RepID=UPI000C6307C5|nr:hypothetical protein [Alcanivorax sp.]MBU86038.1 hypothetical protein [Alcanivorax sp.]|tara:strand:- start:717 stop:1076 length:360 start_codon:yes stop_codon:yes gene_type:complete